LIFGWHSFGCAKKTERKAKEEKHRFLALLEMTPTETALKSQKEGRAEARPYTEQFPA
jgi:hypothetical protein